MIEQSAPPYRYRISGLIVASDVALPMRTLLDPMGTPPADVTMSHAAVPDRLDQPTREGPNWTADDRRLLLDLPGIGRFLAEDGRRLALSPAPGVALEDITVFATGTGLAAILYQRGAMLLHASAVVHDGRAFLFCGPSGAGKSTLTAALTRAGCGFLSDDVCAIEPAAEGPPLVQADGRVLRLYRDSIGHVGLADAMGPPVRQQVPKFHVSPPGGTAATGAGVPVAAIYALMEASPATPPGITPLAPVAAAQALLRLSYRRRLALAYGGSGGLAPRIASLLHHAGVCVLHQDRDFAALDGTIAMLFRHWDTLR
ncbi:hypothetical protein G3576_29660 [Roseomonas stagni]|uniref:Hpr(Ser) kinase/phosphatase n=1 Tax=Falsiroseomonas algicola TaxID=2716930 RepID=A0A6M1LW78_9PROT|nr:hypothetical protein [Falsiroseomonas algicola]NGM24193.1 hypothetical protein [Falsiroseomonas algicola]